MWPVGLDAQTFYLALLLVSASYYNDFRQSPHLQKYDYMYTYMKRKVNTDEVKLRVVINKPSAQVYLKS
jgi:hypothetical protein